MFACLDVQYTDTHAHAAGLVFWDWGSAQVQARFTSATAAVQDYQPGEFYKRELGPLMSIVDQLPPDIHTLVIDGYCLLSEDGRPGLGAHLHAAVRQRCAIVGVAKTAFLSAPSIEVLRGDSARPLYVTALGMPVSEAAQGVASMHGPYRIPTLLKAVDTLAREQAASPTT
ncbi:endonuclease V [Piscinibacter terrae]|uniref:Endonuclease V n=1 Tax=Piscinibacter terrae TaxID=2496871 RepID=A0A3N7HLP0_9BURK|nr:endonuclease V [Albitalea terrae]RQP23048.1 endonuclease V [Albitalea terrae]